MLLGSIYAVRKSNQRATGPGQKKRGRKKAEKQNETEKEGRADGVWRGGGAGGRAEVLLHREKGGNATNRGC